MLAAEYRGGYGSALDANRDETGISVVIAVGATPLQLDVKAPAPVAAAVLTDYPPVRTKQLTLRVIVGESVT